MPIVSAAYVDEDHRNVRAIDDRGDAWSYPANHKMLRNLPFAIAPFVPPLRVVYSVRPVAFFQALATFPSPDPASEDAYDHLMANKGLLPKSAQIALIHPVEIRRGDVLALAPLFGWDAESVDAVMTAAALLSDSGAVWTNLPAAPTPPPPEE